MWVAVFVAVTALFDGKAAERPKLKVLTSFLPVYCFTVNVAGDLAQVENLLPPGGSPHDFQLSPPDVQKFNRADLLIVNGLGAEPWIDKLRRQGARGKKVITAAAGFGKDTNPHIWLDPILAAHAVTNILAALQAADPQNADAFATNARAFLRKLEALDQEFREGLEGVKGTAIITYHDAFPHLARRYGLRIAGVVEETPEVSPGPRHLAKLRRIVKAQGVKAMFTDAEHPQKLAEQLASDFGVRLAPLYTLENGELSRTVYEDGMRKNLGVLKSVLTNHASANAK
jgi:zinc/manganese transport system substrate-binding protein